MPQRLHTLRIIDWHLELACGHHAKCRTSGFYPAAVACPACPSPMAWTADMWITAERLDLLPIGTVPATTVQTCPPQRPPSPAGQRLYTVSVANSQREEGRLPSDYVLWAATWAEAVTIAARNGLADQEQPDQALIDLAGDGLPTIHVAAVSTGMPLHPADTPGWAWNDLHDHTGDTVTAPRPQPAVLVIATQRMTTYTQLATSYHTEYSAAQTRADAARAEHAQTGGEEDDSSHALIPESNWYDATEAAETFAGSTAHLFASALPTLDLHHTATGERCSMSHARLDFDLPAAGPLCPHGCPHAVLQLPAHPDTGNQ